MSCLAFDVLGFPLNWFFTLIAFDKKKECSPNVDWSEIFWPGKNKLHHRKVRVYETIVSRSFDFGLSTTCLVRMRDDMLLFIHSWDNMIYSVHEQPWLLDVNRGNSHISQDAGYILITFVDFIISSGHK